MRQLDCTLPLGSRHRAKLLVRHDGLTLRSALSVSAIYIRLLRSSRKGGFAVDSQPVVNSGCMKSMPGTEAILGFPFPISETKDLYQENGNWDSLMHTHQQRLKIKFNSDNDNTDP